MENEDKNNLSYVRRRRRRRVLRWTLYLAAIVAVLLVTLEGINLGRYFGQILNDAIEESYKGKYSMEFDQINYKIWKNVFVAHNFTFRKLNSTDTTGADEVYVNVGEVEFDVDNIVNILFKKEFSIDGIYIQEPQIIVHDNGLTRKSNHKAINNFYEMVMQTVFALEVENLDVQHASLLISFNNEKRDGNISFDDISFKIDGLKLDAESFQKDLPNIARDVEVSFYNQQFYTYDSTFKVEIDSFLLSTYESRIEIKGLNFVDTTNNYLGTAEAKINVPSIIFEGVDLNKLYYNNFLEVDSLLIHASNLKLNDIFDSEDLEEEEDKNEKVLTYINQSFAGLKINVLSLVQGGLHIESRRKGKMLDLSIDSMNMTVNALRLDSTARSSRFNIHYDDILFSFSNYVRHLPDSMHTLGIRKLKMSATQRKIWLDSLIVQPEPGKTGYKNTYHIAIPQALIENANVIDFLNGDDIEVQAMTVQSPDITVVKSASTKEHSSPSLSDIIENIPLQKIDNLRIHNGDLKLMEAKNLNTTFSIHNYSMTIDHLRKNDTTANIYYAPIGMDRITINADALDMPNKSGQINMEMLAASIRHKINFICKKGEVAQTIKLSPQKNCPANISFTQFRAIGVNKQLLSQKKLSFDTLSIDAIDIDAALKLGDTSLVADQEKAGFAGLFAKYLLLKKVSVKLKTSPEDSLRLSDVRLRFNDLNYINEEDTSSIDWLAVGFNTSNVKFFSGSTQHLIESKSLIYHSSTRSARFNQFQVTPLNKKLGDKARLSCAIGTVDVSGMRILDFIKHNDFKLSKIAVQDWQINADLPIHQKKKREVNLSPILQRIGTNGLVDTISFTNGNIRLNWHSKGDTARILALDKSNLTVYQVAWNDDPEMYLKDLQNLKFDLNGRSFAYNDHNTLEIKIDNPYFNDLTREYHTASGSLVKYTDHKKRATVHYDSLYMDDFKLHKLLNHQDLLFGHFKLVNPDIVYFKQDSEKKAGMPEITIPYKALKSATFKEVELKNTRLTAHHAMKEHGLEGVDIVLSDFMVEAGTYPLPELLDKGDAKIILHHYQDTTTNKLEVFGFEKMVFEASKRKLQLQGAFYHPILPIGEYAPQFGVQTDHIQVDVQEIQLNGFDWPAWYDKSLEAGEIDINGAVFQVYRDKTLPLDSSKIKFLPQDMLRQAPYHLELDTINFTNMDIHYKEKSNLTLLTGGISFTDVAGRLLNVTNDEKAILYDPFMQLDAKGLLFDKPEVSLSVAFDLLSKDNPFTMSASVAPMDMVLLNQVLEPLALVRIKSGYNKKMETKVSANEYYATGTMELLYDKLRVNFLNKKTLDEKGLGPSLGTFFANTFIINRNNPHFLFARDGYVFFERDRKKSIFNYWAKIILSGTVSSIGAKNNKREIKKATEKRLKEFDEVN